MSAPDVLRPDARDHAESSDNGSDGAARPKRPPAPGPRPMELLSEHAEPSRPDWLVHRLIERKTLTLFGADTGTLKSYIATDLARAIVAGDRWLGRSVYAERVLYIDEEMSEALAQDRLLAFGVSQSHAAALRYYSRQGISLAPPPDATGVLWLMEQLNTFRPDVMVIDSLMTISGAEVNDNVEIVALLKALRALAEQYGCAIIVIHHERKQSKGNVRAEGHGILGARQLVGQNDCVMSAKRLESSSASLDVEDRWLLTTKVELEFVKVRRGITPPNEIVTLETEMDDDLRCWSAELTSEEKTEEHTSWADEFLKVLPEDGAAWSKKDLADAVGATETQRNSGAFKDALRDARLTHPGHGKYARQSDDSDPEPSI